ncbi:unnamed protein product [Rotaria sp. Silwood2]|nr:unnamed protein product [Rotaria sp. Silwood2]CAF3957561.1 unnamed protein product [Rotaria sp. Silwood2]
MASRLNDLPPEILHIIFTYLWANEMFHSLYNINQHMNSVLYSYDNYYLDFRNTHKKTYDLLLTDLKHKIKCLVISNGYSVPRFTHIRNFLEQHNLSEFIRLEKLSLIDIDEEYFLEILPNIYRFNKLKCLKLDRLPSYTGLRFKNIVSRLIRLDLPDAAFFDQLSEEHIQNLKCLSVVRCTFEQLKHIFYIVPQRKFQAFALTNGIFSAIGDNSWPKFARLPYKLKRLNLQIDIQSITLNELEELLSQLPRLAHLDIKTEGDIDLANGQRWEEFLHETYGNQLIEFDFCFTIWSYMNMNANQIIKQFSSPYWLNRIRPWYVSYNGRGLIYTVPRYTSTCSRSDNMLTCRTTAKDKRLFFNTINQLTIHNPTIIPEYRFDNIDFLRISDDAFDSTNYNILSIVDLSRIKQLEISTTIPHDLLNRMPNLYHLSLININSLVLSLHKIGWCLKFEQIRVLDIIYNPRNHRYTDVRPDVLCQMFPNVIRLSMHGMPIRRAYLNRVIDRFRKMIYGKFQINWNNEQKERAGKDLQRETCRLISNNDETNFCLHFEHFYLHLFIWDTPQ